METPTTTALDDDEHATTAFGQRAMGECADMLSDLTILRRNNG
jgi:hypothetical protein